MLRPRDLDGISMPPYVPVSCEHGVGDVLLGWQRRHSLLTKAQIIQIITIIVELNKLN